MPSLVQYLCDPCYATDIERQGKIHNLGLDGEPRAVILCSEHEEELIKPLQALIQEYGVKAATAAKRTAAKKTASPAKPPTDEVSDAVIRAWAKEKKIKGVNPTGRLTNDLRDRYYAECGR